MVNNFGTSAIVIILALSMIAEYAGIVFKNAKTQAFLGYSSVFLAIFASSALVVIYPNLLTGLVLYLSIYRIFNIGRVLIRRMHQKHLAKVTLQSFWILNTAQVLVLGVWYTLNNHVEIEYINLLYSITLISLFIGLLGLYRALRWYLATKVDTANVLSANDDLPTVSLLIPARNETTDLQTAIECALRSSYPKLEILVLDDCSQDKTPELIKSYSHAGVRFIQGDTPMQNWLAKNQAYQKLAREASGEVYIFTGVDTSLSPQAISYGIDYMLRHKLDMLSAMPLRHNPSTLEVFVQPMRYWLEFVGSKLFAKRPAVLSTCWFITATSFNKMGSMEGLSRAIVPEEHFSDELAKIGKYAFLRATGNFNVTTQKNLKEQVATAVRTRYPQYKKRPEVVCLFTFASLTFMLGPFFLLAVGWSYLPHSLVLLSAVTCTVLASSHIIINWASLHLKFWLSIINFPIVILFEIILTNFSMTKYEFGTISWKDRNICLPVMHVTPHLPKLKD